MLKMQPIARVEIVKEAQERQVSEDLKQSLKAQVNPQNLLVKISIKSFSNIFFLFSTQLTDSLKEINIPPKIHNLIPPTNLTNKGVVTKSEDHGASLKEKMLNAEMAINKSIFMKTAFFLMKHNAFSVRTFSYFKFKLLDFYFVLHKSGLKS